MDSLEFQASEIRLPRNKFSGTRPSPNMNRIGSEQNIQFVSVSLNKFQLQFINQQLDGRILFNHQLEHLSLCRGEQEEICDVKTLLPLFFGSNLLQHVGYGYALGDSGQHPGFLFLSVCRSQIRNERYISATQHLHRRSYHRLQAKYNPE